MTASALCRWHRAWISGASIACLGIGSILHSGCTPLSNELSATNSQAKQQQTAKMKSGSADQKLARKPAQKTPTQIAQKPTTKTARKPGTQIAKSNAGRVRITDDEMPATEVASNARPSKPAAAQKPAMAKKPPVAQKPAASELAKSKTATPKSRQPETELAADWVDADQPSGVAKKSSKPSQNVKTVAGTRKTARKPSSTVKDPFLPGTASPAAATRPVADSNSKGAELSNEILPEDAVVAAENSEGPRPPKSEKKKPAERQVAAIAEKSPLAKPEADRLPRGSAHERQRANVLMERAYAMHRSGFPEEALRLASVAAELEKSRQVVYRKGEQRPSDFITWLQSAEGGRSAAPPVIRPDRAKGEQTAELLPQPSEAGIGTASASPRIKRPLGEILRAEGESILQPRESGSTRSAARTNAGMELLAAEKPRFPGDEKTEQRASANSPQVAAPTPPETRSADAAVAVSNAGGPKFEAPSESVVAAPADRPLSDSKSESNSGPSLATTEPPAEKPAAAPVIESSAGSDSEPFAEAEAPGLIPGRTTQLTLIGVIGLLTGIAGMAGLSWWHVQERRHFAGK